METTNQSREVKDDKEIEILYLEIEKDKDRVLLNYMASETLHNLGLKKHVEDFLLEKERKNEISNIEVFSNSDIYFRIPDRDAKTFLIKMNDDFKAHLFPFEQKHKGKVFWIFNKIAAYTIGGNPKDESAMVGKGDKTYHAHFNDAVCTRQSKQ